MTAATAPRSKGIAARGPGAPSAPARIVDRTLPAVVVLRLAVVVSGVVVVAAGPEPLGRGVAIAATFLAGDAAWRLLRPGPRGPGPVPGPAIPVTGRAVPGLRRDTVVSLVAVLLSGGWASPFAAVLALDLAVVGLARGYARALAAAGVLAIVCLAGGTPADAIPAAGATPLPLLLLLGAALGGYAHGLTRHEDHDGLGHAVHLADANRLVTDLHDTLRALPTAPDAGTVGRAALDWLRPRVPFVAAAVLVREGATTTVVHAEGTTLTPEAAEALLTDAPTAVVVSPAGPLVGGDRTITLPLALRGRSLGLLVVEPEADVDDADATAVLATLAAPLSLALDTARWFARLSTLAGELERSRLAGDLADRLCQSMAATVFTLDRAAARTGDVDLFRLADDVRGDLGDLRRTLDDLRASVGPDTDLATVVAGCVARAGERSGALTTVAVEASARPSQPVEQQVLRALQEVLAAVEAPTVVDVRWSSDERGLVLSVRHDGRLDVPPSVADRADAVGASLTSSVGPGGGVLTLTTEVQP